MLPIICKCLGMIQLAVLCASAGILNLRSALSALAIRGLVAVVFGLLTFILAGIALVSLVILFGAYALVDGIFNVVGFFRVAAHHCALLIEGIVGIVAGVLTLHGPQSRPSFYFM